MNLVNLRDGLVEIKKLIEGIIETLDKEGIAGEIKISPPSPPSPKVKRVYRKKVKLETVLIPGITVTDNLPEDTNAFYIKPKRKRNKKVADDKIDVQD